MRFELIQNEEQDKSVLVQVLLNRGFKREDILHYLNTDDTDIFDPALLKNIDKGAELFIKHWKNKDKIFVQADADCDGYTSAAALINYINHLDSDYAQNYIGYRVHDEKQHGIIMGTIPKDTKLVIIPDASSSEYDYHKELAESGMDILVIDHHNADHYSEYACVINNQLDDYPNKDLSGATMVYKFCCYLDTKLGVQYANEVLDLAMLGMIADIMPIANFETRQLLNKVELKNSFLNYLFEMDNYRNGGQLNVHTFAWSFAPLINSITRFGSVSERLLVFEALLDFKANEKIPSNKKGHKGELEKRYIEAGRICKNVKAAQDRAKKAWANELDNIITQEHLLDNKIILIKNLKANNDTKNLTGLSAMELMTKYERPVLILSPVEEEDGLHWSGSMRNNGYPIESFQKFALNSGLIDWCNGHDNAAGISIPDANLQKFVDYTNEQLKDYNYVKTYKVDRIYEASKVDMGDIASLADAGVLWGQGIDEPLIAITNIPVNNETLTYSPKRTLQILINSELTCMKTFFPEEALDELKPSAKRKTVDIVGYCKRAVGFGDSLRVDIVDYNVKESKYWDF